MCNMHRYLAACVCVCVLLLLWHISVLATRGDNKNRWLGTLSFYNFFPNPNGLLKLNGSQQAVCQPDEHWAVCLEVSSSNYNITRRGEERGGKPRRGERFLHCVCWKELGGQVRKWDKRDDTKELRVQEEDSAKENSSGKKRADRRWLKQWMERERQHTSKKD